MNDNLIMASGNISNNKLQQWNFVIEIIQKQITILLKQIQLLLLYLVGVCQQISKYVALKRIFYVIIGKKNLCFF